MAWGIAAQKLESIEMEERAREREQKQKQDYAAWLKSELAKIEG